MHRQFELTDQRTEKPAPCVNFCLQGPGFSQRWTTPWAVPSCGSWALERSSHRRSVCPNVGGTLTSGVVSARTPRSVWATAILIVGLIAPYVSTFAWTSTQGPFVDTPFEFARLQAAAGTVDFLRLVSLDNQPPGSMLVTWVPFNIFDTGFTATRLIVSAMAVTALLAVGAWGLIKPTWLGTRGATMALGTPKWRLATGLFGLLVALSPAVSPVLPLLRYSAWMAVLWLTSMILLLKLSVAPRRQLVIALGVVSGLSMLVSFTAIALLGLVLSVVAVRCWRRLPLLLLGWLPAGVLLAAWIVWAGDDFTSNLMAKSGASWLQRITSGYENVSWIIVGPASLPIWPTLIILGLGLSASVILLWALPPWSRAVVIVGAATAVGVFSFVTLVNGNMAGPTLTLLLAAAALTALTPSRRIVGSAIALSIALGTASVFVWSNTGVLRPFYWSNAGVQAVDEVRAARSFDGGVVINFGDGGVRFLLEEAGLSPVIEVPVDPRLLAATPSAVVVRGDEIDKDEVWKALHVELAALGFKCVSQIGVGPYDASSVREALGMYNVATPQYRIYRFERSAPEDAQEQQDSCE